MIQLTHISTLPFFFGLISTLIITSKLNTALPSKNKKNKYTFLTGLRSILAIGVLFHHSIIIYYFYQTGKWDAPPSIFYTILGQLSVATFFSLTSFLFFSKILSSNKKIIFTEFIMGRIKRIGPVYILASVLIIISILINSSLSITEPLENFIYHSLAFVLSLGSLEVASINLKNPNDFGASVFWTLRYEWKFYLLIPVIAIWYHHKYARNSLAILAVSYITFRMLRNYNSLPHSLLFFPGIIAAHFNLTKNRLPKKIQTLALILCPLSILLIFMLCTTIYTFVAFFLLCIFFVTLFHLPQKNYIYKILEHRSALLIGEISYSIYLLHLIILSTVLSIISKYYEISNLSAINFWIIILCSTYLIVFISYLSFKHIEYPFMKK